MATKWKNPDIRTKIECFFEENKGEDFTPKDVFEILFDPFLKIDTTLQRFIYVCYCPSIIFTLFSLEKQGKIKEKKKDNTTYFYKPL